MTYEVTPSFGAAVALNTSIVAELLSQQSAFDNVAWTKTGGAIVADFIANGQDGAKTADKFTEDTGTSEHKAAQSISITTGLKYRLRQLVKAGTCTKVSLIADWTNGSAYAKFDLTDGVVNSVSANCTGAVMEPMRDGWFWLEMHFTVVGVVAGATAAVQALSDSWTVSYLGSSRTLYLGEASLKNVVWDAIKGIHNGPNGPTPSFRMIEATCHDSNFALKKPSFRSFGAVTFDIYYDSSDAVHAALYQANKNKSQPEFLMTITDQGSESYEFAACVSSLAFKGDVEGFNVYSVTLDLIGDMFVL